MGRKISIIVNLDTRPGFMEEFFKSERMSEGVRSLDFFMGGLKNKRNFFQGYDIEVIIYIDQHNPLPEDIKNHLINSINFGNIDTLVFSKHKEWYNKWEYFPKWNDLNFLNAIILSKGEFIVHFDGDMAAFRMKDSSVIDEWIDWLDSEKYKFISYPSPNSPNVDIDPKWDYNWASTRFFICKRDQIDYTEILKCTQNEDYLYGKYGEKYKRCPWLEHVLGIRIKKEEVFYPPPDLHRYMIFTWKSYYSGILEKLNEMDYIDVLKYIIRCGGMEYPCDVRGQKL